MASTSQIFLSELCAKCNSNNRRESHSWCKKCHATSMREWRKTHPMTEAQKVKDRARSYAGVYLREGRIAKENCTSCGSKESQMHHPDYSKPIDIVWLCRKCHLLVHKKGKQS